MVSGLVTVKYIYGASTSGGNSDDVIGSSLQGKLETGITMSRLTTIIMPMRGACLQKDKYVGNNIGIINFTL